MEIKITLSNSEYRDLETYCNLNKLDKDVIVKKSYKEGFNIERYGLLNAGTETKEKIVEKEVIKFVEVPKIEEKEVVRIEYVEIEKEKPIEVIKEVVVEKIVEVIKEVPVDRVVEKTIEITKEIPVEKVVIQEIVKEVPVDKIVYVTDQQELNEKIFQKEQDFEEERRKFSTKIAELENFFQNKIKEIEERPKEIIEVIKEIPVEKIVIKEVQVEKEKIIEVEKPSDDKVKLDALQQTVMKLRQENIEKEKKIQSYEQTIQDIQKMNDKHAIYLRGSNLDDKLYK